ncbi:DUF1905 domain-containing protein [Deinococcus multiflagellatus]|uniref:DUF1905 domain-containing protein n=1 Tax=Deinococcus multiflagellatus TaxID=1656887 RepID=UPI001CCD9379|nr:DUF1905 domain-containing protein [Deinococcus multiflagellatus]MBZ9712639.1 DUF1905 domain-containing protein [Deinococcus multiflagellatus]
MSLQLQFSGPLFHWAGPAPHYFVAVPEAEAAAIRDLSRLVTYGWGMIPAQVQIGQTTFKTSLFPKKGGYLVPVKVAARRAEGVEEGQTVTLTLTVG